MAKNYVRIKHLENHGDLRGDSFNIPKETLQFVGEINDIHLASITPNSVRGNHYHIDRKEFIVVCYSDFWTLGWDSGEDTDVNTKVFKGQGVVLLEIESEAAHAIKNTGKSLITIIALSNKRYDPNKSDTFSRVVLSCC